MLESAMSAFRAVHICKLFHEYGKLDALDTGWTIDEELWWSMICEALCSVSGFVRADGNDWGEERYYFSDKAMMEYYRLCRKYCVLFCVSLKDNPFMKKAEEFVDHMLQNLSGNYDWLLHTKINHGWASGIYFVHDQSFDLYGLLDLIEAMLEIFRFYEVEVDALKKAIADHEKGTIQKEAA